VHDEPQALRGQGDLPLALRLNDQLGHAAWFEWTVTLAPVLVRSDRHLEHHLHFYGDLVRECCHPDSRARTTTAFWPKHLDE
jgi:fatty acid desaturase